MSDTHSTTRTEKDPLGQLEVPADAYYGVQTQRAIHNFPISGRLPDYALVAAAVQVKKAAARANNETGRLPDQLAGAIIQAADEILGLRPSGRAAPDADRQLPRRSIPGRRRRVAQHEHQRGARQPGDRDTRRAGSRQRAARRLLGRQPQRPRQHGTVDERHLPDVDAHRHARQDRAPSSQRSTSWQVPSRSAHRRSTTSSSPAARTCRMPCRSASARSSRPTR